VELQIADILMSTAACVTSADAVTSCKCRLPHVWWSLFTDFAPQAIKAVGELVCSCAPTSSAGERSFKQRSRVHTKTRNRLSAERADKTQAILFNKQLAKRQADGVMRMARLSALENGMRAAVVATGEPPAASVAETKAAISMIKVATATTRPATSGRIQI
jgi:hAT family C-terminal dimerisation region